MQDENKFIAPIAGGIVGFAISLGAGVLTKTILKQEDKDGKPILLPKYIDSALPALITGGLMYSGKVPEKYEGYMSYALSSGTSLFLERTARPLMAANISPLLLESDLPIELDRIEKEIAILQQDELSTDLAEIERKLDTMPKAQDVKRSFFESDLMGGKPEAAVLY